MAERCYLHKTRESTGACATCGRPICTRCTDFVGLRVVCPACREEARASTRIRGALRLVTTGALAVAALAAAVWLFAGWMRAKDQRVRHLVAGDEALLAGAYATARQEYEAALAGTPDDPEASGRLGLVYLAENRTLLARPLLEKAVLGGAQDPQIKRALESLNESDQAWNEHIRNRDLKAEDAERRAAAARARLESAQAEARAARASRMAAADGAEAARLRAVAERRGAAAESLAAARIEAEASRTEAEARRAESASRLQAIEEASVSCPVPVTRRGNRLLIEVDMDGSSADFVLDTGATGTVVTREFTDSARLAVLEGRTVTAHTAGGTTEYALAQVGKVSVAGRAVDDLVVAICDECALGDAAGLLGMDVLRALHIQLDLPTGRARFADCTE